MEKTPINFAHFQHFSPFLSHSWQFINLKSIDVYTFERREGGGVVEVCVYTLLNVNSYERPLTSQMICVIFVKYAHKNVVCVGF